MTHSDQQLEQLISDADQSLLSCRTTVTGYDARRRAGQIKMAQRRQGKVVAGLVVAAVCLMGWRFLMPPDIDPLAKHIEPVEAIEVRTNHLLAELEELQKSKQAIDNQLVLWNSSTRIQRMNFAIRKLSRTEHTPKQTYLRNRDTWTTLQQMVSWEGGEIPTNERWRLEMLANGFPDTTAGSTAQLMLSSNQIPDSLFE